MNTIVKSIAALTLVLLMVPSSFGQESKKEQAKAKKEKIEALKKNYITKELELTTDEEKVFWPLYDEMSAKLKSIKKEQRTIEKDLKVNHETLSDSQKKDKALSLFDSKQKDISTKRDYYSKIGNAIGYSKSTKLLSVDKQFKRKLMNHLSKDGEKSGNKPNSLQRKN